MIVLRRFNLVVQLLLYTTIINALPPSPFPHSTSLNPTNISNSITNIGVLTKELTAFPPGPPSNPFYYIIPDTDLAIHFAPLGHIPHRNETLVEKLLREALYASLNYRITAKMPVRGYQLQERDIILSVSHSVGVYQLTWGMWTVVLTAMTGYVQAYPGYDFMFEIEFIKEGDLSGYMIGAGFAMTRG